MRIPQRSLKEYIQANIIKEHDLNPKLRELHDKEMEEWRNNRK